MCWDDMSHKLQNLQKSQEHSNKKDDNFNGLFENFSIVYMYILADNLIHLCGLTYYQFIHLQLQFILVTIQFYVQLPLCVQLLSKCTTSQFMTTVEKYTLLHVITKALHQLVVFKLRFTIFIILPSLEKSRFFRSVCNNRKSEDLGRRPVICYLNIYQAFNRCPNFKNLLFVFKSYVCFSIYSRKTFTP